MARTKQIRHPPDDEQKVQSNSNHPTHNSSDNQTNKSSNKQPMQHVKDASGPNATHADQPIQSSSNQSNSQPTNHQRSESETSDQVISPSSDQSFDQSMHDLLEDSDDESFDELTVINESINPTFRHDHVARRFLEAARVGLIQELNTGLVTGTCVNLIEAAFLIAAEHGQLRVVNYLINRPVYQAISEIIETDEDFHSSESKEPSSASIPPIILDLNCTNDHHDTALHLACRAGHYEIAQRLVEAYQSTINQSVNQLVNQPINQPNINGQTALHVAVDAGHAHIVALLLDASIDVNLIDCMSNSALHLAAAHGHQAIIQLLINHLDTSMQQFNHSDETAIESAKNGEIVRFMIECYLKRPNNLTIPSHLLHLHPNANTQSNEQSINQSTDQSINQTNKQSASQQLISQSTKPESSPHIPHTPIVPQNPFRPLRPPGSAAAVLFWTSLGVGQDSFIFQSINVYPFDRLTDTERIVVLTQVCEAMSGFNQSNNQSNNQSDNPSIKCTILNESALYAVFALMKARIKKELEESELADLEEDEQSNNQTGHTPTSQTITAQMMWRKRVLDAFEQIYSVNLSACGVAIDCYKRTVWNTLINLIARSLFGEAFWLKKRMFQTPNTLERMNLMSQSNNQTNQSNNQSNSQSINQSPKFAIDPSWFVCRLPNTASVEIQLTFKKLITMSKTFLCDERSIMHPFEYSFDYTITQSADHPHESNQLTLRSDDQSINQSTNQSSNQSCFCTDCVAEVDVPTEDDKRKSKKRNKSNSQSKSLTNQSNDQSNTKTLNNHCRAHCNHRVVDHVTGQSTNQLIIQHTVYDEPSPNPPQSVNQANQSVDELIITSTPQLRNFWSSLVIEEKWCLTEMSINELHQTINQSINWESLRSALSSYLQYAYDSDVLDISEQCVTIADDMCSYQSNNQSGNQSNSQSAKDKDGMVDVLQAMIDAVMTLRNQTLDSLISQSVVRSRHHSFNQALNQTISQSTTSIDYDQLTRHLFENVVLCCFARKVANHYLHMTREAAAKQVELEAEIQSMQEQENAAFNRSLNQSANQRKKKKLNRVQKKEKKAKDAKFSGRSNDQSSDQPNGGSNDQNEQSNDAPVDQSTAEHVEDEGKRLDNDQSIEQSNSQPVGQSNVSTKAAKKKSKRVNSTVTTLEQRLANQSIKPSVKQSEKLPANLVNKVVKPPASSSQSIAPATSPATQTSSTTAVASAKSPAQSIQPVTQPTASRPSSPPAVVTSLEIRAAVNVDNPFAMLDDTPATKQPNAKTNNHSQTISKPINQPTVQSVSLTVTAPSVSSAVVSDSSLSIAEVDDAGITHIYPIHALPPHLAQSINQSTMQSTKQPAVSSANQAINAQTKAKRVESRPLPPTKPYVQGAPPTNLSTTQSASLSTNPGYKTFAKPTPNPAWPAKNVRASPARASRPQPIEAPIIHIAPMSFQTRERARTPEPSMLSPQQSTSQPQSAQPPISPVKSHHPEREVVQQPAVVTSPVDQSSSQPVNQPVERMNSPVPVDLHRSLNQSIVEPVSHISPHVSPYLSPMLTPPTSLPVEIDQPAGPLIHRTLDDDDDVLALSSPHMFADLDDMSEHPAWDASFDRSINHSINQTMFSSLPEPAMAPKYSMSETMSQTSFGPPPAEPPGFHPQMRVARHVPFHSLAHMQPQSHNHQSNHIPINQPHLNHHAGPPFEPNFHSHMAQHRPPVGQSNNPSIHQSINHSSSVPYEYSNIGHYGPSNQAYSQQRVINQTSLNQPVMNQSSIHQSINHPVHQAAGHAVNHSQPAHHQMPHASDMSNVRHFGFQQSNQPTNHLTNQSINQSINQLAAQTMFRGQPQPMNRSNQTIDSSHRMFDAPLDVFENLRLQSARVQRSFVAQNEPQSVVWSDGARPMSAGSAPQWSGSFDQTLAHSVQRPNDHEIWERTNQTNQTNNQQHNWAPDRLVDRMVDRPVDNSIWHPKPKPEPIAPPRTSGYGTNFLGSSIWAADEKIAKQW